MDVVCPVLEGMLGMLVVLLVGRVYNLICATQTDTKKDVQQRPTKACSPVICQSPLMAMETSGLWSKLTVP